MAVLGIKDIQIFYQTFSWIILVKCEDSQMNEFYQNKRVSIEIAWYSFKYEGCFQVRLGSFHSNHNCANIVLK